MGERFDLAVIGAGPGGAACALEAARLGLSVAVLDPEDGLADKPCGEGLMPSGVDALRRLGLSDLLARGRPFVGLRHLVGGAAPLSIDLPRPGVALRRTVLGAGLASALDKAPGVRRIRAAGSAQRVEGGFAVDAGPLGRLLARALVVADGGTGRGAPWLATRRRRGRPSSRFGLRARARVARALDRVEVHMGRGCEIYLTPLPGDEVNVAVLFERLPSGVAGPEALLAWGLERYPEAAAHLGAIVTAPSTRALHRARPRALSEGGAFLVGDAAGLVDPIVGCGVTIALRTGIAAAQGARAVRDGTPPSRIDRAYAATHRRECAARHLLATVLRHGDRHPRLARVTASLLGRMPRAGRAMVRVAAGAR